MVQPIILCLLDSGEIRMFPTLELLESAIEAVDVVNGEYRAYDSAGLVVELTVDQLGAPRAFLSNVSNETELRSWIFNQYESNPAIRQGSTLAEMVKVLQEIYK